MNFLKLSYAIPVFIVFAVTLFFFIREEKKKSEFIERTFFKKKTFILKFRNILIYLGIILLGISLLDPRGPEEKLESNISDQKTIIIIDSSASMLAEDVRPNRFKKSLLMARHFIKKAYGHKIAVVLFSDTQKRLVPFTDDLDLLDARVASLEKLSLYNGGSNISQAIKESLGYFRLDQKEKSALSGNLLVFTDSEGHDDGFTIDLPETVSLAVVGVGTARGSRIPNRDRYGVFRGYKKHGGKEVVTKLNEGWLEKLSNSVKTYRYWIANSYSIPTEEVLAFFNDNYEIRLMKGRITTRPVKVDLFLIPAFICFIISFLLYSPRSFHAVGLFVFLAFPDLINASAVDDPHVLEEKIKEANVGRDGKIRLAELYLKDKKPELARVLYEEIGVKTLKGKSRNNYALALLATKDVPRALQLWSNLQKDIRNKKEILSEEEQILLRQNILLALNQQKQRSKQKQKDEKKKSEDQKKDQKNQQQKQGDGKKEKQDKGQKGKEGQQKNGKDEDSQQKKDSGKNGDKSKDKKESDEFKNKNKIKDADVKPKTVKETQEEIRKKRKMVKVPAIIKQIMSDDRNLQQKHLDTRTEKPNVGRKKDW